MTIAYPLYASDRPQETRQRRRRSATQLPVKPTSIAVFFRS
ncbi:MAG: hypothetical protein ACYTX0_49610 [Nostoc sp.]